MRKQAPNAEIRANMAAYGITVKELAQHMGAGRSYTSVLLSKEDATKKQLARIKTAINELIDEAPPTWNVPEWEKQDNKGGTDGK